MALFSPPPSKIYTEHITHTTIFTPPLHHTKLPRTIRIHVADPDATDSSSDENDTSFSKPRKIRKYINEITIKSSYLAKNNTTHVENSVITSFPAGIEARRKNQEVAGKSRTAKKMRKYRGVRQRKWGTWAAEISGGATHGRLWLGTYKTAAEAAMVYDHAAVVLRGPHALTNFGPQKSNNEDSESTQCLVQEVRDKERVSGFSDDVFVEKDPFNDPEFDPMDFSMFDFEKECRTMFAGSVSDIGLWPTRDYFQELGDLFGSDPLVSL